MYKHRVLSLKTVIAHACNGAVGRVASSSSRGPDTPVKSPIHDAPDGALHQHDRLPFPRLYSLIHPGSILIQKRANPVIAPSLNPSKQ